MATIELYQNIRALQCEIPRQRSCFAPCHCGAIDSEQSQSSNKYTYEPLSARAVLIPQVAYDVIVIELYHNIRALCLGIPRQRSCCAPRHCGAIESAHQVSNIR